MATAEDRLEIFDVIARWSHAVDGNPSALADVVTDDASFTLGDAPSIEGRAAIVAWARSYVAENLRVRRHVRNTVIDTIDDGLASARMYYLITAISQEGRPEPISTGVYTDEILKTNDGWRIRRRRADPDGQGTREPRG